MCINLCTPCSGVLLQLVSFKFLHFSCGEAPSVSGEDEGRVQDHMSLMYKRSDSSPKRSGGASLTML